MINLIKLNLLTAYIQTTKAATNNRLDAQPSVHI
jgi:hypothetical protein